VLTRQRISKGPLRFLLAGNSTVLESRYLSREGFSMEVPAKTSVRFADFALDLSTGELRSNGDKLYLQEKPFQILLLLLERPGQLVTREQLVKQLWPDGIFVDFDQSLNKAVNRLREALRDSAEQPKFIETLPRRGYRFIGQVENHCAPRTIPEPITSSASPGAQSRPRWLTWFAVPALALLAITVSRQWFAAHRPYSNPLQDVKQRRLTANPSENAVSSGVISADGKLLAYSDLKGIHIQQIDTGQVRDVPMPDSLKGTSQSWGLVNTWIRDGSDIVANATPSGQPPSVWLVPVTGEPMRRIRDEAFAWTVSRDGSWVAFGANLNNLFYREMWIMRPDGSDAHKVFDADKGAALGGAEFSPDGRRLAYVKLRQLPDKGEMTFESRPLEGGPPTTAIGSLYPNVANDWSWSPDGRIIYSLLDSAENTYNFWQVKLGAQTGEPAEKPKRLTNWSGFSMDDPSLSADGKRLTFLRSSLQSNLHLAELRAGGTQLFAPTGLSLSEGQNDPVGWTKDSKTLVFLSDRSGRLELFRQTVGEKVAEPIASKLEDSATDAHVSPDGAWILYLAYPNDWGASQPVGLMRVRLTGGAPQLVFNTSFEARPSLRCARNSATLCLLAEKTPDHTQLVFTEVDLVRGRGREIARFGIKATRDARYVWDISPDGTRIAILKQSEATITLLSLAGNSTQEIAVKAWPKLYGLDWSADGQGLFVSALTKEGSALLHLDLQGNAHPLWYSKGGIRAPGDLFNKALAPRAVPSPDGHYLAIQSWRVSSNIWMIENF
jgi:DNA-binding winged helix-turn-helix (wHTH) protein/Tol biopolymer transport system component